MTEDFRIRALIVDDEPLARRIIRRLLARHADVELVGECANGYEAIAAITEQKPNLVFLDIKMPEIDGFDVLERIDKSRRPLVLFVTGREEHALKAYDYDPVHFLHKPLDQRRFDEALQRVKKRLSIEKESRILEALEGIIPEPKHLEWLVIKCETRDLPVRTREIDWVDASGKCTWVHVEQKSYISPKAIGILENQLDPEIFVRGNRSFIVNINFVKGILHPTDREGYRVVLKNGKRLNLSAGGREKIKKLLGYDS